MSQAWHIFQDEEDKRVYMDYFQDYCIEFGLKVFAWCLMDNHVHFIVEPLKSDSMANVFKLTHMRYSHYFNKKLGAKGHLWQGRFFSCPLDGDHLYEAIRYVELNPLRANMVYSLNEYYWSSSWDRLNNKQNFKLDDFSSHILIEEKWSDYLRGDLNEEIINRIKKHTISGKSLLNYSES